MKQKTISARTMGRAGGSANTPAQIEARRLNGLFNRFALERLQASNPDLAPDITAYLGADKAARRGMRAGLLAKIEAALADSPHNAVVD